ncbi:MAG: Bax inhibitor-1/YccA family protein [Sphingobacteriia bacterium]|nr:Bax inhibitor-1/YccA family protein [Sphingobacteriia bacterium]
MKFNQNQSYSYAKTGQIDYHEGLRKYMLRVYNYMGLALAITGLIAMFASSSPAFMQMMYNPMGGMTGLGWLIALAPIGFVMFLSFGLEKMQLQTAQMVFWGYAAVMGLSLSSLFLAYTGESIARVFFITASVFGGMSIYGYTTKKDLTKFGSFLMMGLFGVIIASLVNLFLKSSGLVFVTSLLGTFIFIGLVAYDTQRIKQLYFVLSGNPEGEAKSAILGALTLYLDFINIFIHLLQFLGQRRND